MTALATPISPPADLMELFLDPPEDGYNYELVDGEIVRLEVSALSTYVATLIASELVIFLKKNPVGWAMTEANIVLFAGTRREQGRRPDVAYFELARMPQLAQRGKTTAVPNLVVEVLSPNDNAIYLERKLRAYHKAGIGMVWVVVPQINIVRVSQAGSDSIRVYEEGDRISLDPLLPGCELPVADFFPPMDRIILEDESADEHE